MWEMVWDLYYAIIFYTDLWQKVIDTSLVLLISKVNIEEVPLLKKILWKKDFMPLQIVLKKPINIFYKKCYNSCKSINIIYNTLRRSSQSISKVYLSVCFRFPFLVLQCCGLTFLGLVKMKGEQQEILYIAL